SVAQAFIEAEQHFAQPNELRRECRVFVGICEPQGRRDSDLCLDFGNRAARDRYKSSKLSCAKPATPFSDIGRNRHRTSSKLRDESELLFARKHARNAVDLDHDLHGELPRVQISVRPDPVVVRFWHSRTYPAPVMRASNSPARRPAPIARMSSPALS